MVGNSRVASDKKIVQVLSRLNKKEQNIANAVKGLYTYSWGYRTLKSWEDKGIISPVGSVYKLTDKGKRILNLFDNVLQSELTSIWN